MSGPLVKNDRCYTYADYLGFPEGERWEILSGVAYAMSPAPTYEHQRLALEIASQAHIQLRGQRCQVLTAPLDVRFEDSDAADVVVQPDVLVVCDAGKLRPSGVVGAPDWIVEVLSPATAGKDHILKRALYERHGVREYWLVHPVDRIVTIYRLGADTRYQQADVRELLGSLAVDAVPGLVIDWDLLPAATKSV